MIERLTPKLKQEQCSEGLILRMWTDKEGDYVLFSDYQKEISSLKSQLAEKDNLIQGIIVGQAVLKQSVEVLDEICEVLRVRLAKSVMKSRGNHKRTKC